MSSQPGQKPESLRDTLPAAHRGLLPALYDRPNIKEPKSSCNDCAMCPKGDNAPAIGGVFFKPDLKCCTYEPTLPNFLVGAILADESEGNAEGRRRVKARIASRIGVTPRWLAPPRKQRVLLEAARGSSFGRSKVLQCPYYGNERGGTCTIWQHRESICSTFFCKHDAGAVGDAFWMANKNYLGFVELSLARHAASKVSPDVAEPTIPRLRLTVEDLEDRAPNEYDYTSYWGEWVGREEEFYLACYSLVSAMTPADLDRVLDEDPEKKGPERLAEATRRYDILTARRISDRLIPNPGMRTNKMAAGIAVTTYSIFNSQCLSEDLFAVVNEFKAGETVADTRARLKKEHDLDIPDELLLSLQHHEILVTPGAPLGRDPLPPEPEADEETRADQGSPKPQ